MISPGPGRGCAAAAAIGYLTSEQAAANANLSAASAASAKSANASLSAAESAVELALAAEQEFDDSYRPAAVDKARALAAADKARAQAEAANEVTQTNELADAYVETITAEQDSQQTWVDTSYSTLVQSFSDMETAASNLVDELLKASDALAQDAANEAYDRAEDLAEQSQQQISQIADILSTRITAAAQLHLSQRKRQVQQQLADIKINIETRFGIMQGQISSSAPVDITYSALYGLEDSLPVLSADRGQLDALVWGMLYGAELAAETNAPPSAPGAGTVLRALFCLQGQNIAMYDKNGLLVGQLDPDTMLVHRTVPYGEGLRSGVLPLSEIQELLNSVGPQADAAYWDLVFGGKSTPPEEPDDTPLYVDVITYFVGVEKLAEPGGLDKTLLITVQLATEITGTLDPTPLSDLVNAGALAIDGDFGAAAVTLAGAAVPGGLEKIAQAAKRVPVGKVNAAVAKIASNTDDFNLSRQNLLGHQPAPPGLGRQTEAICPDGQTNCFVGGTLVLVAAADMAVESEGAGKVALISDALSLASVTLVSLGLTIGHVRRERKRKGTWLTIRRDRVRKGSGGHRPDPPGMDFSSPARLENSAKETKAMHHAELFADETLLTSLLDRDSTGQRQHALHSTPQSHAPSPEPSRSGWTSALLTVSMLFCLLTGGVGLLHQAGSWLVPTATASSESPRSLLASGHFKPIEQVRPNDRVLSRDQHGRTIAYQPVEETYRRTSYHLRHLTFQSASGTSHQTQTLQTTDEHPFWNASTGAFTNAGKLKVGDRVTGPDGRMQVLAKTERTEHPEGIPVFNFRVADYHTYYAAAPGGTPVLVHNSDCALDAARAKRDAMKDMLADEDPADAEFYGFKPSGNYTHYFESGMKYHGVGDPKRARQTAKEKAEEFSDKHVLTEFEQAPTRTAALIEEARRIKADGGIGGGRLYNKINSPGRGLSEQ